jgi:hypothetical protein
MADSAIPAAVQRSVSQLEVAMSDLQKHIRWLVSLESLESLVLLSAADRAAYFLAIAKATNALFCCKWVRGLHFLVVYGIGFILDFHLRGQVMVSLSAMLPELVLMGLYAKRRLEQKFVNRVCGHGTPYCHTLLYHILGTK